jgi:transketolase
VRNFSNTLSRRSKWIRRESLKIGLPNGFYHYGGSFSVAEILLALYDQVLQPEDRAILSKGHAWLPQIVLLRERGLDPQLCGHPQYDEANGIYATTGSLGHGMPLGLGRAKAKQMLRLPGRVFVIIGDGEAQEGTFWESLLVARQHALQNLTVVIDYNGIQGSGFVDNIMGLRLVGGVAKAAGWAVREVDGHDVSRLAGIMDEHVPGLPKLVIAHTVKGRGVPFMENDPSWHARYPSPEEQD